MIVLLGKNGSGKTYLAKILKELGYNYTPNYTTRPKRVDEIDGIDYVFINEKQFLKLVKDGFFVEYKEFAGSYYGTPISKLRSDSITIAGNTNLLNSDGTNPLEIVYIHSDIDKRFERIKKRNEAKSSLFDRMHKENFEYLYDFNGYFIDNSNEQGEEAITKIINTDGSIKNAQILSNYQFLDSLKYTFNESDSQLLNFLKFEEQLLIKIKKQSLKLSENEMYDLYINMLMDYSKKSDTSICPNLDKSFKIICDKEIYEGKYLEKKLKRE